MLLSELERVQHSVGERQFEIYGCGIEEPGFRSYHERLQTFLLWYVDAASFIDVDDDHWRYYLMSVSVFPSPFSFQFFFPPGLGDCLRVVD